MVDVEAGADDARAAMDRFGVDWVGVTEEGRLLGYVAGADVRDGTPVGELPRDRVRAWCTPSTPVRQALDTLVTSRSNLAVVLDDDGTYLGMLDIDAVSGGVTS